MKIFNDYKHNPSKGFIWNAVQGFNFEMRKFGALVWLLGACLRVMWIAKWKRKTCDILALFRPKNLW